MSSTRTIYDVRSRLDNLRADIDNAEAEMITLGKRIASYSDLRAKMEDIYNGNTDGHTLIDIRIAEFGEQFPVLTLEYRTLNKESQFELIEWVKSETAKLEVEMNSYIEKCDKIMDALESI